MFGKQVVKIVSQIRVFVIVLLCILTVMSEPTQISQAQEISTNDWRTFLPIVRNGLPPFQTSSKFIGIYMDTHWNDSEVNSLLSQANQLAGKKHSVVGWFIELNDIAFANKQTLTSNNFVSQLESLWKGGYVSFVNINVGQSKQTYNTNEYCPFNASAYQIENKDCDRAIQEMAKLYKQWISRGGGRIAFIAPFPEMNGVREDGTVWTPYGGNAANFKLAYQRIVNIFSEEGVSRGQVWWVFAPNGWSKKGHEFENYYPGQSLVDVIGFSSYNYGFCRVAIPWQRWETYNELLAPYLDRIQKMDPSKPIILAQTGTTAEYSQTGETNVQMKNIWLHQNYEYLAQQTQVLGILYYDKDQSSWECNWRILPGNTYSGYTTGVAHPAYQYLDAQTLKTIIP